MKDRSSLKTALVLLVSARNVLSPVAAFSGEHVLALSRTSSSDRSTYGVDVVLTQDGVLHGMVVHSDGRPLVGTPVYVRRAGRVLAEAKTGPTGRFSVTDLPGGMYQVQTGSTGQTLRLWAPGTAPPSAASSLRLVSDGTIVRGQGDRRIGLSSDAILLGAVIAAGVTVPVLISNRRSDSPPGS